jgi:hypothetical protein
MPASSPAYAREPVIRLTSAASNLGKRRPLQTSTESIAHCFLCVSASPRQIHTRYLAVLARLRYHIPHT